MEGKKKADGSNTWGDPLPDKGPQLKVVQRVADGLALEMNNVLAAVIGHASVLEAELSADSPARDDVEAILAAGRTALDLTRDLLHFSRQYQFAREPIALNELVGKAASMWKHSWDGRVRVECDLESGLLPLVGDEARIRHLLQELAVNACDAMADGGVLKMSTKNVCVDTGKAPDPAFSALPPGNYLRLQVTDTGRGMDSETLQHAFEPLFTTRGKTGAMGLGLTQVYDTVQRHSGAVQLSSKPGAGTTVTAYFPASSAHVTQVPRLVLTSEAGTRGLVLVVDDDRHVLRAGNRLLTKLGYRAVCMSSTEEALAYYTERNEEVALVILDLIMPDMDGPNLLAHIRQIRPDARVLIASGFEDEGARRHVFELGASEFLPKPYTLDELQSAIHKTLD